MILITYVVYNTPIYSIPHSLKMFWNCYNCFPFIAHLTFLFYCFPVYFITNPVFLHTTKLLSYLLGKVSSKAINWYTNINVILALTWSCIVLSFSVNVPTSPNNLTQHLYVCLIAVSMLRKLHHRSTSSLSHFRTSHSSSATSIKMKHVYMFQLH